MTYNKNQILKSILLEFLNKKIIKMPIYLEMVNNMANYTLVEDFLIHCITKFDIPYVNFPSNFKTDIKFLKELCAIRPSIMAEIKKSDKHVYNALFTNLALNETELTTKLTKEEKIKIRKIGVISPAKQVG